MSEPSKGGVSVIEDDSLARSIELSLVDPYFEEPPFEELYSNDVLVGAALSIGHMSSIYTEPLDLSPHIIPTTFKWLLLFVCISQVHYVTLECIIPPLIYIIHAERTRLEESCRVLSLIMILIFLWHFISLRCH